MIELPAILKAFIAYKKLNRSPSVLLWLARPGSLGGTELQVRMIAEYVGNSLVVIQGIVEGGESNLFVKQLKKKGIDVLYLGRTIFASQLAVHLLKWMVPRIAICHFFNPASTFFIPILKRAGFQIFYTETGMPARGGDWEILTHRVSMFDFVTSVSHAGLDSLRDLYGYQGPSLVVPTFIESFPRQKHHPENFHLVYFGRLAPMKGVDLLIVSFMRVLKQLPEAHLTIIGSGESFKSLQGLAKSEQIELTGWVEREELYSRLETASLVCLPSETEGLPSSILEAMSMGLPVLATNVGGVSEILEDGVTGVLIPPRDEEALTEALLELAGNPKLRDRLGKAAFAKWEKREKSLASLMAAYGVI